VNHLASLSRCGVGFVASAVLTIGLVPGTAAGDPILLVDTAILGTEGVDVLTNPAEAAASALLALDAGEGVQTFATGMDGLGGGDQLTSAAALSAYAESLFSPALKFSATPSEATACGLDGGPGDDTLNNNLSGLTSAARANTYVGQFMLQLDALGLTGWPTEATALAWGMDGGDGVDTLASQAPIVVAADADAWITKVTIGTIDVPLAEFGKADARSEATAAAVGLSAGEFQGPLPSSQCPSVNCETLTNTGPLAVHSTADATTVNVSAEAWGAARIDDRVIATADATGMAGSDLANTVSHSGSADIDAVAQAALNGGELKMSGLMMESIFELFGLDVGNSETTATARASGLDGGGGDDTLSLATTGAQLLDVYGSATAESLWLEVGIDVSLGGSSPSSGVASLSTPSAPLSADTPAWAPAYLNAATRAVSSVCGADAGSGDDTVTSDALLSAVADANATHTAVAVDLSLGKTSYLPSEATSADTSTFAFADARGLDGGAGKDKVVNRSYMSAIARAVGTSTTTGVGISGAKQGLVTGVTLSDSSTHVTASASGIDGGSGEDTIDNYGGVAGSATATANATTTSVTLSGANQGLVVGVTVSDSSSTSAATGRGIAGGAGSDTVTNYGDIAVGATANTSGTTTSITLGGAKAGVAAGVTLADASTLAAATGIGIDASSTAELPGTVDDVENLKTVSVQSHATAETQSVGITVSAALQGAVAGAAVATGDSAAAASSTGIRTGAGDDSVSSNGVDWSGDTYVGAVNSLAEANATSNVVAVTLSAAWEGVALGATVTEADTVALANAVGLDAGAGDDDIDNKTGVASTASANASSNNIGITVAVAPKGVSAGFALSTTTTDSASAAVGLDAGSGDDKLDNVGHVKATASATSQVKTITINFAEVGAAIADASSNTAAVASGLRGGEGADELTNAAAVNVVAHARADDTLSAANLAGFASGDTSINSSTVAVGMDAGNGISTDVAGNTVKNDASGVITVNSLAEALADQYVVQGGGAAFAKAGAAAYSSALGLGGGSGQDTITNAGAAAVAAAANVYASSFNFQLFGVQLGHAGINAASKSVGIDGYGGANTIANSRQLNVYSAVNTLASSVIGGFSAGITMAGTTADTIARGIATAEGTDVITNDGSVAVTASSLGQAGAGAIGLVAAGVANALASADLAAVDSGAGSDTVINRGNVTAGALAAPAGIPLPLAKAHTEAIAFDFFSFALSSLGARADVAGIAAGAGNDTVTNQGDLTVGTTSGWMVVGESIGVGGQIAGSASALACSDATVHSVGIDGGTGADSLTNAAGKTIAANASSYADVYAWTTIALGFLPSNADATARASATGTGMRGGDGLDSGGDTINNAGTLTSNAVALADAFGESDVSTSLTGGIKGEADADATATAHGMAGGGGANHLSNSGALSASASAFAVPWGRANAGGINTTEAWATLDCEAEAAGITSGDYLNTVSNEASGTITVSASARTDDNAGSVARAISDTHAKAFAGTWTGAPASGYTVKTPVSASASGMALGDSNDDVTNHGGIHVAANSVGAIYACSGSNCFTTYADAYGAAGASGKGIAAGKGANAVNNDGVIDVLAASHAQPATDATSRDQRGNSNAVADSDSDAIGIEGDHSITNAAGGQINVVARTTAYADGDSGAEASASTATLRAVATGLTPTSTALRASRDILNNYGWLSVLATTGEDAAGAIQSSAWTNTHAWVRSVSSAAGTSTASEAVGIRAGENRAEITNTGTLSVIGRSHAWAVALAYSRDYNPAAAAASAAASHAYGIRVGGGDNLIVNDGSISVGSLADSHVYVYAEDDSNFATEAVFGSVSSTVGGSGVWTGDGANHIVNRGSIAFSANLYQSWIMSTEDYGMALPVAAESVSAIGVQTGAGNDIVEHYGSLTATWTRNYLLGLIVTSGNGTAIQTGAGNDRVLLGLTSSTVGDIDLGQGDDMLVLAATGNQPWLLPTINGAVQPGGGTNVFGLGGQGIGAFNLAELGSSGRFPGFDGLWKEGTGQWALGGTAVLPWAVAGGELVAGTGLLGSGTILPGGRLTAVEIGGDIFNDGILAPGPSVSRLLLHGDYEQTSDAVLRIELASAAVYDFVLLSDPTASALLAGTLEVSLVGDFLPELGDTFLIFGGTMNIFGDFDEILPVDCAGRRFSTVRGTDYVALRVDAVPLPPTVWLFFSGLAGLLATGRRKAT
jgi:fibronectin-binding autotransporter adhesin